MLFKIQGCGGYSDVLENDLGQSFKHPEVMM